MSTQLCLDTVARILYHGVRRAVLVPWPISPVRLGGRCGSHPHVIRCERRGGRVRSQRTKIRPSLRAGSSSCDFHYRSGTVLGGRVSQQGTGGHPRRRGRHVRSTSHDNRTSSGVSE